MSGHDDPDDRPSGDDERVISPYDDEDADPEAPADDLDPDAPVPDPERPAEPSYDDPASLGRPAEESP